MLSQIIIILIVNLLNQGAFTESAGYVEVEAEDFHRQTNSIHRQWKVQSDSNKPEQQDPDSLEFLTASNGRFMELLPDTRVTHDDEFLPGVNFSNEPGLSVLEYDIQFPTPENTLFG